MTNPLETLRKDLKPLRDQLLAHPIYKEIQNLDDFRLFMQHHIFAVWDFMTQVKALQRSLTCISLPWHPVGDNTSRRLINEIVLEEESDEDNNGNYLSHFELYRKGMIEAGADPSKVNQLIMWINEGIPVEKVILELEIPESISLFLMTNWNIVKNGDSHEVAAAFTFGREDLIPDMFRRIVMELKKNKIQGLETLIYYLERHIDLDEEHHNPMAMKMLQNLCGNDPMKWQQADRSARLSLQARIKLWDGVVMAKHHANTLHHWTHEEFHKNITSTSQLNS